jgi:rubrerythrin
MTDGIMVRPVIRAEGEVRRASSSCHGAKLDALRSFLSGEPVITWLCQECGRPCERAMSEPEKVVLADG